jgi:hypothetical protein
MAFRLLLFAAWNWAFLLTGSGASNQIAALDTACRVVRGERKAALEAPAFVYRLDTAEGLRAESFENRLTGQKISLGLGAEMEVDLGPLGGPLVTPKWRVTESPAAASGPANEATFVLVSDAPALSARVTYRWNGTEPVLRKFVEVTNRTDREVSLLNLRLGTYRTDARLADREIGFPLYLDGEFFISVAHPAGWATGKDSVASLRQYPGTKLSPGQSFTAMETIYGVGAAGDARKTFLAHIRSRMRRVVRHHDHPYAIFDNFASWSLKDNGFTENTEANELYSLNRLAESQRATGCKFDLCNIHFWVDHAGDLIRFNPKRFPNGIAKIKAKLDEMGVAPGLWIDSSMADWSIGGNPEVRSSLTDDQGFFCRASEPIKSMYLKAFLHHIREEGIREIKFDNLRTTCNNTRHGHLPGIYSTEAIENSVIEFLEALDKECPEVFLILYWGHRSPWWLLHGDTLFDSGIGIEAATPSTQPSAYARDSITQKLDQAQRHASDVPSLGKDSLGVWLSDWAWNSSVGKERWQEGMVMDICRGSLLAQLWADREWLSPPEWQQMADLIGLLRAQPKCFANPRFILGNAQQDDPYGYCCTDGQRAFLALNNCTWKDSRLTLRLNSAWGLPDGRNWDLYRWYPRPARLNPQPSTLNLRTAEAFGDTVAIALRPFEVDLLEVIPAGQSPSLGRKLPVEHIPDGFVESSRAVQVTVKDLNQPKPDAESESRWTVLDVIQTRSVGGTTLTRQPDGSLLAGGENPPTDTYIITAKTALDRITGIRIEALPDPSLPGNGPGRAVNGNFALCDLQVTCAPLTVGPSPRREGSTPDWVAGSGYASGAATNSVALYKPMADFSQEGYGGWPVAAAIDGDSATGWSVDPAEGMRHEALFQMKTPVGYAGGTKLVFTLKQGERQHTLGRFRLSATTALPPFPKPPESGLHKLLVQGQAPTSAVGGILVVAARLGHGGEPTYVGNVGVHFTASGTLAGKSAPWLPVLGKETYPSAWQAWRVEIGASVSMQPFELSITTKAPVNLESGFTAHFLPR